jgi:hypothetical protein
MAFIPSSDKDIEKTNLETHVVLSLERNKVLEDKITATERKIADIIEQTRAIKRILLGAAISALFGIMGTLFTVAVNFPKH